MAETQITREMALGWVRSNLDSYPHAPQVSVHDPFTGESVGTIADCGSAEVNSAVAAALRAFKTGLPRAQRITILEEAARGLDTRRDEFAAVIALETGKSLKDCRTEVARATETLRYTAAEARTQSSRVIPADAAEAGEGALAMEMRVPRGVVGAITPFNFPLNTSVHKVAPALAVGCSVVHKPAHQTPLTALALQDLFREAGLGAGWLEVCTDGGGNAGRALVEHSDVAVISFTGSNVVGWEIAQKAPKKKVLLELGSNAPVIVTETADLAHAAKRIATGGFGSAGQSCISVQRVIAHQSIASKLEDHLAAVAGEIQAGDPFDPKVDIGPLISLEASSRVREWVQEAVEMGGAIVGNTPNNDSVAIAPIIISGAPEKSRIRQKEIFGPVITVLPYNTFDEALAIANDTIFGLQAGVFTSDVSEMLSAFHQLEFGGVLINDIPTVRLDHQPYGGVAESGNTREGPHYAMEELTHLRYLSIRAGNPGGDS
ncbi:aldehyde dehydrogenase (NAD-dependent) [Pontimonas salivibrio]|uniref:Aldehyde dehydrogenase (NAD-dependent) n=1 Tax=Pontimonas salivibrio TaxID=1159327 RepID=A0A2L2BRC7_9MICO|nr:aldehyde dehydrogenase family protein [Pontimonas salivibrio]AVG24226.1 aldehyde dehydrogenase (NAD-dependent) [Pontimonas salivibrio]